VEAPRFGTAPSCAPAKCLPFESNAPRLAAHRGVAPKLAAHAQAGSLRVVSAVHRNLAITRPFGFCKFVVGASRHSAAPGSQSVESRRHRRRALGRRWYASAKSLASTAVPSWPHRALSRVMPNPSIERTLPGKPVSASHVKR
jgi:hypothetical protein